MKNVKKVVIRIESCIDGEKNYREYPGEYVFKNNTHNFVYTDYEGNLPTKNGIQASDTLMLIHRVGGITSDMLFDTSSDTIVNYEAFMVSSVFVLHTYDYNLSVLDGKIEIYIKYGLNNKSDENEIFGEQKIEILKE